MRTEKMKTKLFILILFLGIAAISVWYFMGYTNRSDYSKNSTLIKEFQHIGYCLEDTAKTIAGCLKKGLGNL